MITIAVDAMGGDYAPQAPIEGAIEAVKENNIRIYIVGQENVIYKYLKGCNSNRIIVYPAVETVSMRESPAIAIKYKKDSSIAVATRLVAETKADAIISAGNSGAVMGSAMLSFHCLNGIFRPAISAVIPTLTGWCVLIDVGATIDCKPKNLFQFAIMGSIYMKEIFGIEQPRIGLVSIGTEEEKGNEVTAEAFAMLKASKLNFVGNIEGYDIPLGKVDVAVCDGFIGNVLLKFGEGVAEMLLKLIKAELKKHPIAFFSVPFIWGAIKGLRKKVDYSEYGGALLLGVNGTCIICHGRSNAKAIKNAIKAATEYVKKDINKKIYEFMQWV